MADETTSTATETATTTAAAASTEAATTAESATTPVELKVPEGLSFDDATLSEVKAMGEHGQKAVDLVQKFVSQQAQAHEQQVKAWGEAIAKDPELGGQNIEATRATAQKAMVAFAEAKPEQAKALKELVEQTGLGDHPALIHLMNWVGKALGEDTIAGTAQPATQAPADKPLHSKLYPSMSHGQG